MGKFDETYIVALLGLPLYWVLTMVPVCVKVSTMSQAEGTIVDRNAEPRMHAQVFSDSNHPGAATVRRANACHQNCWENYIIYIAAVVGALSANVNHTLANTCAVVVLVSRALYIVAYLVVTEGPMSLWRSLFYIIGLLASLVMMVAAVEAVA